MKKLILSCSMLLALCAQAQKQKITLEDIWTKGTFRAESVAGFNSMKDGQYFTELKSANGTQSIRKFSFKTGADAGEILNTANLQVDGKPLVIESYEFNSDETKLLLFTEGKAVYRRSYLYKVYAYDLATKQLVSLDNDKILHATFSPDARKVAYVKNNNVFIKDIAAGTVTQVTQDGEFNKIINGNCDWVYEEEFSFTKALAWSPKGNFLAFYRFDESGVKEFNMQYFNDLYPTDYRFKYPKAGEDNSIVSIHCYDLASGKTVTADVGTEKDQYIPRIKWTNNDEQLCILRMNRLQNKVDYLFADARTGKTGNGYQEENKYYVHITDNLTFLKDNKTYLLTSEQDGYNHIYIYDMNGKLVRQVTKGNWEVDNLLGVDEKNGLVYYTSAENSPLERNLYSIKLDGSGKKNLTPEKGWHEISFSKGFQYYLDKNSTVGVPPSFSLYNNKAVKARTLKDNADLKTKLNSYDLSKVEFLQIPNSQGEQLNAWMIKPSNMEAGKKYPVLMYQYSGPGSQEVKNSYAIRDYYWHEMLAQEGYIVVCVDGTGTGGRGEDFKKKTYLRLGEKEVNDQIDAAKWLAKQSYVDGSRLGIWGWSFGGFMSSACIMKGSDVFKMAIAVAPVTDWRYYDNIYTERFMRKPQDNKEGYDATAPLKMVSQLKGKLLLVHGTGDDNVHFQNSIMLVDEMVKAGKSFDSEYYPNKHHGIQGATTRLHLYKRMTEYIKTNL